MKYVKGALIIGDKEVMVELPSDWRIKLLAEKFLMVKSVIGEETAFNTSAILTAREVDETAWNNWMTRLKMMQEAMEKDKLNKKK